MKIAGRTVRFTAPKPTPEDGAAQEIVDPDAHLQQRWTGGPSLRTRAVHGVLVAALVTGPAALLLTVGQSALATAPTATPVATVAPPVGGEQAAVGELARQLVVRWLQTPRGEENLLNDLVATTGLQLASTPMTATDPATAQLVETGPGQWSVTVGVTVTDATAVTVRRYFQVPVRYNKDTEAVVAATLPAPVAAPAAAPIPSLGYRYTASLTDPVAVAAGEFLSSLLTGAGDVTRFVSPGTVIAAVTPPPYTGVQLRTVSTDVDLRGTAASSGLGQVRVLITAAASITTKQVVTVQYALTLTTREGRWEVSSLDTSPLPSEASTSPLQPTSVQPTSPLQPTSALLPTSAPKASSSTTAGSLPAAPSSSPAPPTS